MKTLTRLITAAALMLASCAPMTAVAEYPTKPVRIVVPLTAGGPGDIVTRAVAQRLSVAFGKPFYVENMGGANMNIGGDFVARAEPDGHTLMMMSTPMMTQSFPAGLDSQALVLEDVHANPKPRVSRRGRSSQDGQVIAAYPLPNFDSPNLAGMPAGTVAGPTGMVFQQPTIASDPMSAPQVVDSSYSPTPMMAGVPPLIPQADPAHSSDGSGEMTASTPVVDPY